MRSFFLLNLIFCTLGTGGALVAASSSSWPVPPELTVFLQKVRNHNRQAQILSNAKTSQKFDTQALDAVYDLNLSGNLAQSSASEKFYSGGIRKQFSTGTKVEAQLDRALLNPNALFPAPQRFWQDKAQVKISQEIWRDFNGRWVELQKKALASADLAVDQKMQILVQNTQYQAEKALWQWVAIQGQMSLQEGILERAKRFVELSRKRAQLGFISGVDVIDAESAVHQQELARLELSHQSHQLKNQLMKFAGYTEDDIRSHIAPLNQILKERPLLPESDFRKKVLEAAKEQRTERRLLPEREAAIKARLQAGKERDKAQVSLFYQITSEHRDVDGDRSLSRSGSFRSPQASVGVQIQKVWGSSLSASEVGKAQTDLSSLELENLELLQEIETSARDLATQITYILQRQDIIEKTKLTLRKRIREEKQRIGQARSSEAVLLRYEIEEQMAEKSLLQTQAEWQQIFATARFLTHSYPKGT